MEQPLKYYCYPWWLCRHWNSLHMCSLNNPCHYHGVVLNYYNSAQFLVSTSSIPTKNIDNCWALTTVQLLNSYCVVTVRQKTLLHTMINIRSKPSHYVLKVILSDNFCLVRTCNFFCSVYVLVVVWCLELRASGWEGWVGGPLSSFVLTLHSPFMVTYVVVLGLVLTILSQSWLATLVGGG